MAKDESQTNTQTSPRVYKAGAVHKRQAKPKPKVREAERSAASGDRKRHDGEQAQKAKPAPRARTRFVAEPEPDAADEPSGKAAARATGAAGATRSRRAAGPAADSAATADATGATAPARTGRAGRFKRASGPAADSASSAETTAPISAPESESESEPASGSASGSASASAVTPRARGKASSRNVRRASSSHGESESGGDEHAKEPPKKANWKLRIGIGTAAVIIVALVVTAAVYSWNRWARYDDGADMQGIWYAYGTEVPVTFTENSIVFDENTAYTYEIDSETKTVSYSIGGMEGHGRYWFNDDRSVLIITDGDDYTKWGTALEDARHWLNDLINGASLPMTENSIAFSRIAMTDGFVTVAPEENASETPADESAEGESEGEGQGEDGQPDGEAGDQASGDPTDGDPTDGDPTNGEQPADPTGKDEMKELPISDIIEEDDTPEWGKTKAEENDD